MGIGFTDTINHKMDGTWEKGPFTLILDGNSFVFKIFNSYYGEGIIIYDNSAFKLTSTNTVNSGNVFLEFEGKYSRHENNMIISELDKFKFLNGTWKKSPESSPGLKRQVNAVRRLGSLNPPPAALLPTAGNPAFHCRNGQPPG
jgi:hypothetical protein